MISKEPIDGTCFRLTAHYQLEDKPDDVIYGEDEEEVFQWYLANCQGWPIEKIEIVDYSK